MNGGLSLDQSPHYLFFAHEVCTEMGSINTWKKYRSLESTLQKIAARGNHRYVSFFDHHIRSRTEINSIFFTCDHHFNDLGYALLNDLLRKHG